MGASLPLSDLAVLLHAAVVIAELAIILAAGFFAGKAIHGAAARTFSALAKNTKTQLDDIIFEYTEKPLELILIVSLLYLAAGLVEDLYFVSQTFNKYLYSILIMLGAYLLSEVVGALLKWSYITHKTKAIDTTLLPFARKLSKLLILLFGATIALSTVGIDITGILAITSVLGIIVGLASQETLANIFAGLALQIDRPYVYNEYLRLVTGEVLRLKKIGVRSTKLDDAEGNIVVMSNSEFAKQRIINLSRRPGGHAGLAIAEFPHGIKMDAAISVLRKELGQLAKKGVTGSRFSLGIEKVSKDSFVVAARFECRDYTDIERAREGLNRAALGLIHNTPGSKNIRFGKKGI